MMCKMTYFTFLTSLLASAIAVNSDLKTSCKFLPIDMERVEDCHGANAIYVDKTEFALKFLQSGNFYLFLRPRRFGKTFFLNTLQSILRGKKEVFKNYFIGNPQNGYKWEKHLVLRLTFERENPIEDLATILTEIAEVCGYAEELAHIESTNVVYFGNLLRKLSPYDARLEPKPGNKPPVALLIDEYDLPFKNLIRPQEIRDYFYKFFGTLKKLCDEGHLKFIFITGCNKVNLLSDNEIHSGVGTTLGINDASLLPQYASTCGFTKNEIETYFHSHVQKIADKNQVTTERIYEEMTNWYDGYHFTSDISSPSVYNPISVLHYFRSKFLKPRNYWVNTVPHPKTIIEALIKARIRNKNTILDIKTNYAGDELFQPTEDTHVDVNPREFQVIHLKQPSLESVLFQNGYLTISKYYNKSDLYALKFPNMEIMEVFLRAVELAMEKEDECITLHKKAKGYLQNLHIKKFIETFNTYLQSHYKVLVETNTKDCEALLKSILQNLLTLEPLSRKPTSEWNVQREAWTLKFSGKKGKIDFLIETSVYKIVIECKYCAGNTEMKQAANYTFPSSIYVSNKTPVRLVFNFNEDGIFQWSGTQYDANDKFLQFLDKDSTETPSHISEKPIHTSEEPSHTSEKPSHISRKVNVPRKEFWCDLCKPSKCFTRKSNRDRHIVTIHNNRTFNCNAPDCGKVFDSKKSLAVHQRVHIRNSSSNKNLGAQ